jgi:glycerophosphoryl diester phosphodiesterase
MRSADATLEALMVKTLHAKGYATSAPYGSTAWHRQPVFIQSFEATSLRRFAALTPAPLALLLDKNPAPDTGLPYSEILSDESLAELASFVTVMAPWKAMLYTVVGRRRPGPRPGPGLVLPDSTTGTASTNGTDSSRRLLNVHVSSSTDVGELDSDADSSTAAEFSHPDVALSSSTAARDLQATQQLQSTGLTARLHKHGLLVHTYTIRDEPQFVLPTCKQVVGCEFEFLFGSEQLDGAFADWPGTMHQWVQQHRP